MTATVGEVEATARDHRPPQADPQAPRAVGRTARAALLAAVFVCAACGLVYELALVTLGAYLTGSSITQTSLVIGFVMAAMGLGALGAKPLLRRPVEGFAAVELTLGLIGGLAVPVLYLAFAWLDLYLPAMLLTATAIGALIGAEIPLLMALVQRVRAQAAAGAVADLSAADYLGALIGGLAFPFLLLPALGLLRGALLVGAVNVVAGWLVAAVLFGPALTRRHRLVVTAAAVAALLALAAVAAWARPLEVTARQRLFRDPIVHEERSAYQEIVVTSARRGQLLDTRLFLNGDLQFSTIDEHRYHEALVHPVLAGPHREVLILGGGDGLALREVLGYAGVEEVTLVDLDPAVTALAREDPRLLAANEGAFDDPRVTVLHDDAFRYARFARERTAGPFDAVIVDLPDADSLDTAKLYSVEFYGMVAGVLRDGGTLVVQAGSPFFAPRSFASVLASVEAAGLGATPYHVDVPSFGGWGFVLAAHGAPPPLRLHPDAPPRDFLSAEVLAAAATFPPDVRVTDARPSTLLDPVIVDYQRTEWLGY